MQSTAEHPWTPEDRRFMLAALEQARTALTEWNGKALTQG